MALIAVRPRRSSAIATAIGLSRPATSRQLRLLVEAGILVVVQSRIDGRGHLYSLDHRAHGRVTAWLAGTEIGLAGHAD